MFQPGADSTTGRRPARADYIIAAIILITVLVVVLLAVFAPKLAIILGYSLAAIAVLALAYAVLVVIVRDSRDGLLDKRMKSEGEDF